MLMKDLGFTPVHNDDKFWNCEVICELTFFARQFCWSCSSYELSASFTELLSSCFSFLKECETPTCKVSHGLIQG